jgi:hypothetical protein
MKQEQFTPGPWEVSHGALRYPSIGSLTTHTNVCGLPSDMTSSKDDVEIKANANLIAAAPDMYEALVYVANFESNYRLKYIL